MLQDLYENLEETRKVFFTRNILQDLFQNLEETRTSIVHQMYAPGFI